VNALLSKNVLLFGAESPSVPDVLLRAGPLHLVFREGVFRYIKLERREIVRAVYVAVRDENWRTVPGVLSNLDICSTSDSFQVSYDCVHQERGIDFRWRADVCGDADGCIVWRMRGQAHTSFQKSRIGICVLHPIDESIGEPCQITHTDGSTQHYRFPSTVAPHQPFLDVAAMCFRVKPDLNAELVFAGDVFETEDQRNWTDASFKTYSTPLSLPYPAWIEKGATVNQSFTLKLRGNISGLAEYPPDDEEVTVTLDPEVRTKFPRIGFKYADSAYRLSEVSVLRLKALRPDHLSVDLHPGNSSSEAGFWRAAEEASRLSLPMEVALAPDADHAELKRVLQEAGDRKVNICSWLADVGMQHSDRRAELRELEAIAPVVLGAGSNFAELNRNWPSKPPEAGVWFSLNPQVHASDNTTLIENLAAQSSVLSSIRACLGEIPVTVSPVRLKQRMKGGQSDELTPEGNGGLPEDVDQRQSSLLGAGWTLGTLKHMAEGGVASVTCYETAGWKGIMETEAGSPSPSRFLSIPNAVFPMYHVFADSAAYKCGEVIRSKSSDPLRMESLALIQPSGLRVMVANLGANEVKVNLKLAGIAGRAELSTLDEGNVERYMIDPESRRQTGARQIPAHEGSLHLDLKPYAIATIDVLRGTSQSDAESVATGGRP